jgi:hypothetical protein
MNNKNISHYFDKQGDCLADKDTYFDIDGDLIEWILIGEYYALYPANSDIVKMHYAESYAGETKSNYSARTLFYRAY